MQWIKTIYCSLSVLWAAQFSWLVGSPLVLSRSYGQIVARVI